MDKDTSSGTAPDTEDWVAAPKPDEETWVMEQIEAARASARREHTEGSTPEGVGYMRDAEANSRIPVGGVEAAPRKWTYYFIRSIIVIGVIALVVWVFGFIQRKGALPFLDQLRPWTPPGFELVEARNGRVLMIQSDSKHARVVVQVPDQASWLLVSRDDTNAINPALSPAADAVAYLSVGEQEKVVFVSLDEDTSFEIMDQQVEAAAILQGLSEIAICDWTPLAWSPEGDALVFYGCRLDSSCSLAFIATWTGGAVELKIIPDSEVEMATERQIQWVGSDKVLLTMPTKAGEQLETLPVPK